MVGDPQAPVDKPDKDGLLDQQMIEQMSPAPDAIYLPISDCVTDLYYTDSGNPAPDVEFHYSLKFEMVNLADYNALLEHPQAEEISSTIISYMREHGNSSLTLELERDTNELGAYTSDEIGPNSLTPGTQDDLQIVLDELIPILKETYGIDFGTVTVNTSAQEVDGCGASYWVVPGDQANLQDGVSYGHTAGVETYKPM